MSRKLSHTAFFLLLGFLCVVACLAVIRTEWFAGPVDARVIAAAIKDFAADDELPSRRSMRLIVVDSRTLGAIPFDVELDQEDEKGVSWQIPYAARNNLYIRNRSHISLEQLMLGQNTVFDDMSQIPKSQFAWQWLEARHPTYRSFIKLWLPGYSMDGTQAVVMFQFGPTAHGARATYLVAKVNDEWKVEKRSFSVWH